MEDLGKDEFEKLNMLRRVSLFRTLDNHSLNRLSAITVTKKYEPREIIFHDGDPGDAMYIIRTGRVEIAKKMPDGEEKVLAVLKSGSIFGEQSIIDGQPRSAGARTASECCLYLLLKKDFRNLLMDNVDVTFAVLTVMSDRIRGANQNVKDLEVSANQMEQVVRVITKIARKSNLLALNASIEAARLGSLGQAFQVVAMEIKKLAEQSSDEATSINRLIKQLQEKTKALAKIQ
ncbi:cyclic nucleotide-binding domain-containing protein [Candidatus Riflebacteria bacterium]